MVTITFAILYISAIENLHCWFIAICSCRKLTLKLSWFSQKVILTRIAFIARIASLYSVSQMWSKKCKLVLFCFRKKRIKTSIIYHSDIFSNSRGEWGKKFPAVDCSEWNSSVSKRDKYILLKRLDMKRYSTSPATLVRPVHGGPVIGHTAEMSMVKLWCYLSLQGTQITHISPGIKETGITYFEHRKW